MTRTATSRRQHVGMSRTSQSLFFVPSSRYWMHMMHNEGGGEVSQSWLESPVASTQDPKSSAFKIRETEVATWCRHQPYVRGVGMT